MQSLVEGGQARNTSFLVGIEATQRPNQCGLIS